MSDQPSRSQWVAAGEFGNELEASIAVAILDASGIPAVIRSNDSIGLFGPAFQGFSSHGVTVMVPSDAIEAARTAFALAREGADHEALDPAPERDASEDASHDGDPSDGEAPGGGAPR